MRIAFWAVIAAMVFVGIAQAGDVINTITLTGTIVGGSDSGPNGTNDDAGLFGGRDLLNAPVSVTISYDATLMEENLSNYYNDGVGYSQTSLSGDTTDPYLIGLTIGGISFAVTGTFYEGMFLCSASDSDCGSNFGAIAAEDSLASMIQVIFFNSDNPLAGYDVNNPSDVSAAFNDPNNTYSLFIENGPGGPGAYDILSVAPEPSAWLLLFSGLGGLAALNFRRGAVGR